MTPNEPDERVPASIPTPYYRSEDPMGKKKKGKRRIPSDAELLTELATLDNVEARIPTNAEHVADHVPPWCELVLKVNRETTDGGDPWAQPGWGFIKQSWMLRRHDGELIIEVLDAVLHPERPGRAGDPTWAALDEAVERIQYMVVKGKHPNPEDVGEARGLATALANMTNPIAPDVEDIRAAAMIRYDIRHGISRVSDEA